MGSRGPSLTSLSTIGTIADFGAALEINPNLALTHNYLGLALAEHGDLDAAFIHFQKALDIDPEYAEAHNNFAVALGRAKKYKLSFQHFEDAIHVRPDTPRRITIMP